MPVAAKRKTDVNRSHNCVDYPIQFYLASSALNSGSLHMPRIIAASTIHYGPGHPLNRTEILSPDSDGYMPENSSTGPRMSIIGRRSLLLGLLQALVSAKDIYRVGRAQTCLHICTSSQYLDMVWNEWLPDWETNGWPVQEMEGEGGIDADEKATIRSTSTSIRQSSISRSHDRRMSTASASGYSIAGSTQSAVTGDGHLIYDKDTHRLVNEDLLRKVAIFRRNFFLNSNANGKGAAYIRLINYRENPADRLAKEAIKAASLSITTRLPRRNRALSNLSNGSTALSGDNASIRRSSFQHSRKEPKSEPTSPTTLASPITPITEILEVSEAAPVVATTTPSKPLIAKRQSAPSLPMQSKDVISENGAETDMEDFDDAASTLSVEAPEPGMLAKLVALPTAAVAATVAAIMEPGVTSEPAKAEPVEVMPVKAVPVRAEQVKSVPVRAEPIVAAPVLKNRSSFEEKTNEALAAVNIPYPMQEVPVSLPEDSKGEAVQRDVKRSSSSAAAAAAPASALHGERKQSISTVERTASAKSGKNGMKRDLSAKKGRQNGLQRDLSTKSAKGGLEREISAGTESSRVQPSPSIRSTMRTMRQKSIVKPSEARRDEVVSEPSPPKSIRSKLPSFLSFSKRSKSDKVVKPIVSTAPSKPATDRLIDYRPPQSGHLRSTRRNQAFRDLSTAGPDYVTDADEKYETVPETKSRRSISLFRTRAHVQEIFG
ncbi:hypothetical protein CBS101457_001171 [Exobasidium rhododendri]|nr:hypothetical protein CBS101457_001171 [Exobasidium rhododendri]